MSKKCEKCGQNLPSDEHNGVFGFAFITFAGCVGMYAFGKDHDWIPFALSACLPLMTIVALVWAWIQISKEPK